MIVNPFIMGVFVTLSVEAIAIVAVAVAYTFWNKRGGK